MKFLCIGIEDIGFRCWSAELPARNNLCGLLCFCRLVCSEAELSPSHN